jgi:hypothetical protein
MRRALCGVILSNEKDLLSPKKSKSFGAEKLRDLRMAHLTILMTHPGVFEQPVSRALQKMTYEIAGL